MAAHENPSTRAWAGRGPGLSGDPSTVLVKKLPRTTARLNPAVRTVTHC